MFALDTDTNPSHQPSIVQYLQVAAANGALPEPPQRGTVSASRRQTHGLEAGEGRGGQQPGAGLEAPVQRRLRGGRQRRELGLRGCVASRWLASGWD